MDLENKLGVSEAGEFRNENGKSGNETGESGNETGWYGNESNQQLHKFTNRILK